LALTPKDTETFYREVDEELRRDQLTGFARRYGIALAVGLILILAATGGFLWWQNHKQAQAEQQAETLTAIFDDINAHKTQGVEARLDKLAAEGDDGYRAAALLTKADVALAAGKDAEAVKAFAAIAADEDLAKPYRDAALIRQTAVEFDKMPPDQVIARLKPLAVAGNPWFGSAGEMVAIAYLKQNKPQLAGPLFAAMAKDPNAPRSIRSRAQQMAGSLGIDASQGADVTKEASR